MIRDSVGIRTIPIRFRQRDNINVVDNVDNDNTKRKDKLWNNDIISKTRANIENTINLSGYVKKGLQGDANFNFFEYLKVAQIPYYLGGIVLTGVALASRNNINIHSARQNTQMFKKLLTGVMLYYVGRELANVVIDTPLKWFRGVDLNHPYKKVTWLREGNPLNKQDDNNVDSDSDLSMDLPNNVKKSHQKVFESVEFTRWDLLYKYKNDPENNLKNEPTNSVFDKIAKKFGAKKYDVDSDSKVKNKIKKMVIMANSWKYILSAPFVTLGIGLAYQDAFHKMDLKNVWNSTIDLIKLPKYSRATNFKNKINALCVSLKEGLAKPVSNAFKSLWKGHSLASKIMGRSAIISSIALPIVANVVILNKTNLESNDGGEA